MRTSSLLSVRVAVVLSLALLVGLTTAAEDRMGPETVPLWPGGTPGAKGSGPEHEPTLRIYGVPNDRANGAAIVVCPGGGYGGLAMDHEGQQVANFLNDHGVAAFVLRYRLGGHYKHPAMMHDVQRAIRYVRVHAKRLGVTPGRIGVMGFSAGGHLASTAATHFDQGDPNAEDPVDRVSCRPDFAILAYPVITLNGPAAHIGSRRNLLGDAPDPTVVTYLSNELEVTPRTPPTFLLHTSGDTGVMPENSILFYQACQNNGVPAELHIYQKGRHGLGLAAGDPVLHVWTRNLINWLRTNGFLTDAPRAAVAGTITVDGQPMAGGWITFRPTGKTAKARPVAAAVVNHGQYKIAQDDGPPVGRCRVVVRQGAAGSKNEPSSERNRRIRRIHDKPMTVEIQPGENEVSLDLQVPSHE